MDGYSLTRLRAASADIRSDVGYELYQVQRGEAPADFKAMPDVGSGVIEIRVHADNEFRVFYVARFDEDLGKKRYAALLESRRKRT
jgi:phage-related protein